MVALRVLAATALAVSAYVHLHLAHLYTTLGSSISMGDLFYAQGVIAAVVAVWLLVSGTPAAWWVAAVMGAASFAAVMLYRYVDVGTLGPFPNMYDASWRPSPDKLASAVAEAGVVVLFGCWAVLRRQRSASRPAQPVS
jgi:hypothetical protein